MILSPEIDQLLAQRAGQSSSTPAVDTLQTPNGIEVEFQFLAIDSMGCALHELLLRVPKLTNASMQTLETWSRDLCQRVTYLLEGFAAIEHDPNLGSVLVRSQQPTRAGSQGEYYEVFLQATGSDCFALRRFQFEQGVPGRTQVPLTVTHEVLKRLINDIIETIPNSA